MVGFYDGSGDSFGCSLIHAMRKRAAEPRKQILFSFP